MADRSENEEPMLHLTFCQLVWLQILIFYLPAYTASQFKSAFSWPYSGIRMRIGAQRRFVASFSDKILSRNRPAFSSKEKSWGYSRIRSIKRAVKRLLFRLQTFVFLLLVRLLHRLVTEDSFERSLKVKLMLQLSRCKATPATCPRSCNNANRANWI